MYLVYKFMLNYLNGFRLFKIIILSDVLFFNKILFCKYFYNCFLQY